MTPQELVRKMHRDQNGLARRLRDWLREQMQAFRLWRAGK